MSIGLQALLAVSTLCAAAARERGHARRLGPSGLNPKRRGFRSSGGTATGVRQIC
jgi:hypothetical protein